MFFNFMSFHLNAGPGFELVDEYGEDEAGHRISHGAGRSDYLRADAGLRLVWKLGAAGSWRYVYGASTDELGLYPGFKLPDQSLEDTSRAPVPEDTLTSSVFIGLSDLFGGLGIGWRQNNLVYNLNEKNGKKRESFVAQGFGVFYQTRI